MVRRLIVLKWWRWFVSDKSSRYLTLQNRRRARLVDYRWFILDFPELDSCLIWKTRAISAGELEGQLRFDRSTKSVAIMTNHQMECIQKMQFFLVAIKRFLLSTLR